MPANRDAIEKARSISVHTKSQETAALAKAVLELDKHCRELQKVVLELANKLRDLSRRLP